MNPLLNPVKDRVATTNSLSSPAPSRRSSSAGQHEPPIPASAAACAQPRWLPCVEGGDVSRTACKEILIGVLPGEGIGPEVVSCALKVVEAVARATGLRVQIREGGLIGRDSERACGSTMAPGVIRFCEEVFAAGGAVLNGPGGGRYVYELRKHFDLFFKISPLQTVNGVPGASRLQPQSLRDVDILVTRENTGGVYQGLWSMRGIGDDERVAEHRFEYSESQVRRFLDASARLAKLRRGYLAVVWKESGVPSVSALWRDCAAEAAEACGIRHSMVDVDLMAYRLIQEAAEFDVIAAPNLFGDVLADLGAVLLGSRGVSYSGNFTGQGDAVYQTNHGAASQLAGTDQSNPAGQILSMAMMLRESFELAREANAIEAALRSVWREGWRTADVARPDTTVVGTREFAARVAERAAAIACEGSLQESQTG